MKCRICGAKAVIYLRQHNLALCEEHFISRFEREVQKTIKKFRMFDRDDVVAVGISERSNSQAIDVLSQALSRVEGGPRYLMAVDLPNRRAYRHLDTVFTPADHNAALVYPPVITGSGPEAERLARWFEVCRRRAGINGPRPAPVFAARKPDPQLRFEGF